MVKKRQTVQRVVRGMQKSEPESWRGGGKNMGKKIEEQCLCGFLSFCSLALHILETDILSLGHGIQTL